MLPEQKARENIDKLLTQSGWTIQDFKNLNPAASIGIAVREFPVENGFVDYMLFIDRKAIGVIEAKKTGTPLSMVEEQTARYSTSKIKWKADNQPLRFLYESTGVETRFTNTADPNPRAREIFNFHQPETLRNWLKEDTTLRYRLANKIPPLDISGLRDCQITAITNLDKSFANNKPKALIQMATGAGKTFTAINSIYRLLKFGGAKRILFLVDTKNLGVQAEQEFQSFSPIDDKRKFTELYNVQRLQSSFIDKDAQVCISTIQRMYSILRGDEEMIFDEEKSLNEDQQIKQPVEVVYNKTIPIETFDFIIIDECHRSIYNLWKQVLDYFDAYLIGLTATPSQHTYAYFDNNIVSQYTHEQAVADGVNVGYDVYNIETKITAKGAVIEAKEWVDKRDRQTRKKTWEQLDEDIAYTNTQLDRDVVNPNQIRTIIRTFKEKMFTEIFPTRKEVPKTLIFAKTDSHAEDIIKIVREEFNEGNAFCKKVTYGNTEEKASEVLQQFRTLYNPRIAVTVDMIATGTDVKAIECLLFMRDVKSRNYFEQMKGRGTRTFGGDDLKKVTPSAEGNKTHFVIVDAIGVCKSVKTDSRSLERKSGVSLKDLMMNVVMGNHDEDTLTSLANRLTRLEKQLEPKEKQRFTELAEGKTINQVVKDLLNAYDPDMIESIGGSETLAENESHQNILLEATAIFNKPDLRNYIEVARKNHQQIIDLVNLDEVQQANWDALSTENSTQTIQDFKNYLEEHKDTLTALQIFYSQPYRRRELTFSMIKDLCDKLKADKPTLAPLHIWQAYRQLEKVEGQPQNELIALVSLIRRVLEIDATLTPYENVVNRNFQKWILTKNAGQHNRFNDEQMEWLRMIRDYVANSFHVDADAIESLSPFVDKGGLMKFYQLFGSDYEKILEEINAELAA
ncbi:MAG: hypothetical protein RJA07_1826 [Bacteroidota bacterium]|jgi:type I restriction enzyme R subunit